LSRFQTLTFYISDFHAPQFGHAYGESNRVFGVVTSRRSVITSITQMPRYSNTLCIPKNDWELGYIYKILKFSLVGCYTQNQVKDDIWLSG